MMNKDRMTIKLMCVYLLFIGAIFINIGSMFYARERGASQMFFKSAMTYLGELHKAKETQAMLPDKNPDVFQTLYNGLLQSVYQYKKIYLDNVQVMTIIISLLAVVGGGLYCLFALKVLLSRHFMPRLPVYAVAISGLFLVCMLGRGIIHTQRMSQQLERADYLSTFFLKDAEFEKRFNIRDLLMSPQFCFFVVAYFMLLYGLPIIFVLKIQKCEQATGVAGS